MRYCYIVAEGQHDIEFLVQLIKPFGLSRITKYSTLDGFWKELIPKTFPIDDDLMKRVPIPIFLQNAQISVALHSATGIERIVETLEESLAILESSQLFGICLLLDADTNEKPSERFQLLIQKLSSPDFADFKLSLPSILGEVIKNSPRFGIFIIPNNEESGTLEDILIECAELNYANLLELSKNYVNLIDRSKLDKKDLREIKKPAGKNKAIISIISSVLKPGKAIQVSLQDNRWIDEETLKLSNMILIRQFLKEVLGIDQ
ncbi:MAG TPA: hypothetical protein DEG17_17210 [Cyanobacteria bacterium UBA11149]|nr:hypothetical protein [Cyanobacteria bacterium UBA11367]HBE58015.1 hypothetical protein [Cyanobacteria bacterium UBA11366]HBK66280.1 hypothetical protein [Cyanobacteria bacterium UBA11166]HBR72406.1 hypothetical protein [Cyanobacteria bacterium UBA11159]HBS71746.1 hypothetical protein [Cyanobacteria bacterium UBA11153]HBW90561.1 hypothetical protein [Cyanobacteria bacterium UBA11149]HCA93950.1 hypothetical protein [Cyanobacteria bacterium UBA9226]